MKDIKQLICTDVKSVYETCDLMDGPQKHKKNDNAKYHQEVKIDLQVSNMETLQITLLLLRTYHILAPVQMVEHNEN